MPGKIEKSLREQAIDQIISKLLEWEIQFNMVLITYAKELEDLGFRRYTFNYKNGFYSIELFWTANLYKNFAHSHKFVSRKSYKECMDMAIEDVRKKVKMVE